VSVAAFIVVAFMLAMYATLDGYDLGVAAVMPLIARSDEERAAVMRSIGPFWNGNEVWLIVAGGALFALFPAAYASSFSGFYLPFIIVVWLLMFRGIALELRGHFPSELWHQFWDVAFSLSSTLLVLLFGVALGNLLRGLPLDRQGYFQGTFGYLFNPYAGLVGVFALAALSAHGAAFAAMRIEGSLGERALRLGRHLWWAVLVLFAASSAASAAVRGFAVPFWLAAIGAAALGALVWNRVALLRGNARMALAASASFILLLMTLAAGTIFPYLLPAYPFGHGGLSIYDSAPLPIALTSALVVTIGGSLAVLIYAPMVWRRMAAKIRVE
jgi:cytochrome d ubiquinol oxidase subunit II